MPDNSTDTTSQIQAAIQAAAPKLASALGGPDADVAMAALGRVLCGDAMASATDVLAALHTADRATIQAAEQDTLNRVRKTGDNLTLAAKIVDADTTITQAAIDDTEKARLFQVASHDTTSRWLAFGVSIVFGIILILILIAGWNGKTIEEPWKPLLYTLLGVLATSWANIISFYFGSSASSQQKSQAINASMIQQSTANAAAPGP